MRPAILALAVTLCLAAPLAPALAQQAPIETVEITARPITQFRMGSSETRFGPLEFVGGLEMRSRSRHFGALSSFRFLTPGRDIIGVADTGFWFFGRVERDELQRPVGMADFTMQQMVDRNGNIILDKGLADAEGLAVRDGIATVGFERHHRISEFRVEPTNMKGRLRNLDFLVPAHELRHNRGFETITFAHPYGIHEGARIAITEKSLDGDGNVFAAIIEGPARGVFTIARHGDFDITDGVTLDNGDLLLLERSYSVARSVGMRLRRIYGESIMKGMVADGPILFEADMSYQIDNMEGMDVWRREDGALVVALMSDDNHSILQRNLYLEFILHED